MTSPLVVITDHAWPSIEPEAGVLARIGCRILVAPPGDAEALVAMSREADAILTCFAQVTEEVVRAATRLQVIGRYGVGVDNIAVTTATELGIPVTNVPAYCLDEVAEHTLALLFALTRRIREYDAGVRRGSWALAGGAPLHRMAGATLGVVGYGAIGRTLARRAGGLGLRVIAHDPTHRAEASDVTLVSLDELLSDADFVSLHLPLTAATEGLVDAGFLSRMKPTAFLINTSRGSVVDQVALYEALQDGTIAGAGLDVVTPEQLPPDHELLACPNLIITPHVAFYSEESVHDLEVLAAENVVGLLSGERPRWIVNPSVLELPRWVHLRPSARC